MVKPQDEVIAQFHAQVNMSADELAAWLAGPQSAHAGTGAGIESGHRIVAILRKNPGRDPEQYDAEDIKHMRTVVAYNARHMAQEDHLKDTKTREELEQTKSTISMKNWGHDPIKTLEGQGGDTEAKAPDAAEGAETVPIEPEKSDAQPDSAARTAETKGPTKNGSAKRKLKRSAKQDASKDEVAGGRASADEDTGDDSGVDDASLGGEDGTEQRARKKSKTTGATQHADAEETTEAAEKE